MVMTGLRDEPMPLTAADQVDVQAVITMLALARMKVAAKREAFYRAAGQHLAHMRDGKHSEHFAELVRQHCGIGLSRAYELIAIARGKPLAELRAEKAGRASGKVRQEGNSG